MNPIAAQPSRSASRTVPVSAWSVEVAQLFDPFYRARQARDGAAGGWDLPAATSPAGESATWGA